MLSRPCNDFMFLFYTCKRLLTGCLRKNMMENKILNDNGLLAGPSVQTESEAVILFEKEHDGEQHTNR